MALCTDGHEGLSVDEIAQLSRNGIALYQEKIASLVGCQSRFDRLIFENGQELKRAALFSIPSTQQSDLAKMLGCEFTEAGGIVCRDYEATNIRGVYAAGDVSRGVQLAIEAAAEGARAAFGINKALNQESLKY